MILWSSYASKTKEFHLDHSANRIDREKVRSTLLNIICPVSKICYGLASYQPNPHSNTTTITNNNKNQEKKQQEEQQEKHYEIEKRNASPQSVGPQPKPPNMPKKTKPSQDGVKCVINVVFTVFTRTWQLTQPNPTY